MSDVTAEDTDVKDIKKNLQEVEEKLQKLDCRMREIEKSLDCRLRELERGMVPHLRRRIKDLEEKVSRL